MNLSELGSTDAAVDAPAPAHDAHAGPLAGVRTGERVAVVEVGLDADLGGWLEAMGLGPGQTLTVVGRAAFGGPLHVRTGSGGELAINAALARSILVVHLPPPRRVT